MKIFKCIKQYLCLHENIEYKWNYKTNQNTIVHHSRCKRCELEFILEDKNIFRIK